MNRKWEDIEIGEVTGRVDFIVTSEMADEYIAAVGMPSSHTAALNSSAGRLVPVDMVCKLSMRELFTKFTVGQLGPNLRAKQTYRFIRPILVGTRVSAVGRITDKYQKRGKSYLTLHATFVDESGQSLVVDERVVILLSGDVKIKG